jgi:2-methylcitrate synthase/citrate synthase II
MSEKPAYSPGLEGVIAGESAISYIDTALNRLIIRGYDLVELTQQASYEELAYLLLYGDLPTTAELDGFNATLSQERTVPEAVMSILRQAPASVHPMSLLRTAVSALEFHDPDATEHSTPANIRKTIRLLAKIPTLITAGHRLVQGQEPIAPRNDLSQAGNLLYMLHGKEPAAYETAAMNVSLILYAEHGYNASAFAARVTASTLSNLHAAITTGIGTLAGPLHGGANEAAMEMLLEVGGKDQAEAWVLDALAKKKKIMGFGHREYKNGDSRVPSMKAVGRRIAEATGDSAWVETADIIEATMDREKGIFPNVDFPCAYTYYMMGIPIPLYTPIFVSSRVAGWAAHIIEQLENNRLIRPNHIYTGSEEKPLKPLAERG